MRVGCDTRMRQPVSNGLDVLDAEFIRRDRAVGTRAPTATNEFAAWHSKRA
jgi:hypothetical protein